MRQNPYKMDVPTMRRATWKAGKMRDDIIARARNMELDPQNEKRLKEHQCRACFYYGPRIGGAAMTTRPCMCCGQDQTYGSTSTDALCDPCAREGSLCKHCGGDLDMNLERKDWPVPKAPA